MILSSKQIDDWDWVGLMISLLRLFSEFIKGCDHEHIREFLTLTISKDRFKNLVEKVQSFITLSIMNNTFDSRSIE